MKMYPPEDRRIVIHNIKRLLSSIMSRSKLERDDVNTFILFHVPLLRISKGSLRPIIHS